MPMPPMPRMCTGPDLAGHLHGCSFPRCRSGAADATALRGFRAALPTSSSTRSASRVTASGRPWRLAAAAASASASRRSPAAGRWRFGKPLRRQILLLDAPSAARFGKPRGVLQLVVVDRMRQRHQDRRAAHDGQLGHGRGAGAADHEVRLGHLLGQIGEKRGQMRAHAGRPGRPASTRPRSSSRHCCTTNRPARISSGSSASAGGSTSEKKRAPWLPPNTRSENGPSRTGALIALRRPVDHLVAHGVAGDARPGERRPLQEFGALERGGDGRDALGQHAVGAPEHGVLLVQGRRNAAQAGRDQRREGRIAAEADDRTGLHLAQQLEGGGDAARQQPGRARAAATGERDRRGWRRERDRRRARESPTP